MTDGLHTYRLEPSTPIPWMDRAACATDAQPQWFYPDEQATHTADLGDALACCDTCPVRPDCLEHAIAHDERYGIWGGTTPDQRRMIARRRRA